MLKLTSINFNKMSIPSSKEITFISNKNKTSFFIRDILLKDSVLSFKNNIANYQNKINNLQNFYCENAIKNKNINNTTNICFKKPRRSRTSFTQVVKNKKNVLF